MFCLSSKIKQRAQVHILLLHWFVALRDSTARGRGIAEVCENPWTWRGRAGRALITSNLSLAAAWLQKCPGDGRFRVCVRTVTRIKFME